MNKNTSRQKENQKITRAPTQGAAAASEKAKQARDTRIKSHNIWPLIATSQAEEDFTKLIDDLTPSLFLSPYKFQGGDASSDFHRHLGMLIDALEMLPGRPDHAFDISFRVVDELSQKLTSKGNITDALGAMGAFVCNNIATSEIWKTVINLLSENMPAVSGRYIAQRLLEIIPLTKDSLKGRAETILGEDFSAQFHQKYRLDLITPSDTSSEEKIRAAANNRAGEFLCLLISTRKRLSNAPENNKYPKLDLSESKNIINESVALTALMSLFAFTARNERVHGSSLSPFRSSKASLTTYASYYFQFHLLYAVSVGLMVQLFPGCGDAESWADNVSENMNKYQKSLGNKYSRKA